jgi:Peptide-N-glycosidase F, C terminal
MSASRFAWHAFMTALPAAMLISACGSSSENVDGPNGAGDAGDGSTTALEASSEASDDAPTDVQSESAAPGTVVLDHVRIGSKNGKGWPNYGFAWGDIDFGSTPAAKVVLVLDLESPCYPFEEVTPPPVGQNWPANCDAFDRNFSVFVDDRGELDASPGASDAAPPSADAAPSADAFSTPDGAVSSGDAATGGDASAPSGPPPFELVHAITPFGGPEHLETDITDFANGLPGKHRLKVDIDSWSDPAGKVTGSNGGWIASARLVVTPGTPPHHVLAVLPVYLGRVEAADTPPVLSFAVPAGTTKARFEYRTSGHGGGAPGVGCIGPAEEFCDRRHEVYFDGTQVDTVEPWRDDCAALCTPAHAGSTSAGFDYCLQNPNGAPQSVQASRANWCPGSMTPPFVFENVPALSAPGPHTWTFKVLPIVPVTGWSGSALPGGNWQGSAIYYAFGP